MLVTLENGFLSLSEASSEFPFLDVSNHLITIQRVHLGK